MTRWKYFFSIKLRTCSFFELQQHFRPHSMFRVRWDVTFFEPKLRKALVIRICVQAKHACLNFPSTWSQSHFTIIPVPFVSHPKLHSSVSLPAHCRDVTFRYCASDNTWRSEGFNARFWRVLEMQWRQRKFPLLENFLIHLSSSSHCCHRGAFHYSSSQKDILLPYSIKNKCRFVNFSYFFDTKTIQFHSRKFSTDMFKYFSGALSSETEYTLWSDV